MFKQQNGGLSNKPAQKTEKQIQPECEEIARVAYELYEQRGRQDGRDQEDWFSAETVVRQRRGQS